MSAAKKAEAVDIYEGMSEEDIALMKRMSGQNRSSGGDRVPVLKINLSSKADKNKNKVDVGNFVLGQSIKLVDGAKVVEDIGKDLGPTPEVTVFAIAQQYNFYSPDKAKRCSSQLLMDRGETPIGSTLKHDCSSGKCPRRAAEVPRDEKCTCQHVVFLETADKEPGMMYLKGASFMPCADYVRSVVPDPFMMFPTILNTKEKSQGSVDYYEIWPTIDKTRPYPIDVRRENLGKLKSVSKNILEFKESQVTASKQVTYANAEVLNESDGFADIEF